MTICVTCGTEHEGPGQGDCPHWHYSDERHLLQKLVHDVRLIKKAVVIDLKPAQEATAGLKQSTDALKQSVENQTQPKQEE